MLILIISAYLLGVIITANVLAYAFYSKNPIMIRLAAGGENYRDPVLGSMISVGWPIFVIIAPLVLLIEQIVDKSDLIVGFVCYPARYLNKKLNKTKNLAETSPNPTNNPPQIDEEAIKRAFQAYSDSEINNPPK